MSMLSLLPFPWTNQPRIEEACRFYRSLDLRGHETLTNLFWDNRAIAQDWILDQGSDTSILLFLDSEVDLWRKVWREGFLHHFDLDYLRIMEKGLEEDDSRILQGVTCSPPPLQVLQDMPVEGSDILTYPYWVSGDLQTVGEIEEAFARMCYECDQRLGEPAAYRHFLNWWDATPGDEIRHLMLDEIRLDIEYLESIHASFTDSATVEAG